MKNAPARSRSCRNTQTHRPANLSTSGESLGSWDIITPGERSAIRSRRSVLRGLIGSGAAIVAARAGTTLADLPAVVGVRQFIPGTGTYISAGWSTSMRGTSSWPKAGSAAPIAARRRTGHGL